MSIGRPHHRVGWKEEGAHHQEGRSSGQEALCQSGEESFYEVSELGSCQVLQAQERRDVHEKSVTATMSS